MTVEERVRDHFHADADRFDAIYLEEKGPLARWIDGVWRGVVRRRFQLTIDKLQPLKGKTILDVGCGSGRYCVACVQGGAAGTVGIDFAPAMIDRANEIARQFRMEDRCRYIVGAFPEDLPEQTFDACLAMGFFDYIPEPLRLIREMRRLTRGQLVMSFPKANEWRVPIRRIRFLVSGCPLFLYSESQVRSLLRDAEIQQFDWVELDRDYIVIAGSLRHP